MTTAEAVGNAGAFVRTRARHHRRNGERFRVTVSVSYTWNLRPALSGRSGESPLDVARGDLER